MQYSAKQLAKTLFNQVSNAKTEKEALNIVDKFLNFCDKNNLLSFLPNIRKYLLIEFDKLNNDSTLKIYTTEKLNKTSVDNITKLIGKKNPMNTEEIIDEEIIGGFRAEFQNVVYDGTVQNNLKNLKQTLLNK
jgi:F0F1-type ATP synthase delta subunit